MNIELLAPAGNTEALDAAVLPSRGEGGEDVDEVVLALHQKFGDTGADAEIAIDLEGSVGIVEVVVDTTGVLVGAVGGGMAQGILDNLARVVAVLGTCPEVDLPAH